MDARNDLAEMLIRGDRRAGEMLAGMAEKGERRGAGRWPPKGSIAEPLESLGITKNQSPRWQRIAGIPDDELDRYIDATKEAQRELTLAGVFRLADPTREPASIKLDLEFEGNSFRTLGTADQPLWVAVDWCRALGLGNPSSALRNFRATEKGINLIDTPSGPQRLLTVTEAGLYRLLLRSDKPDAGRFRDWVTHDVLPSIRTHGCYPPPAELTCAGEDRGIVPLDRSTITEPLARDVQRGPARRHPARQVTR